MDWLKSTNPIIDWVIRYLELTAGAKKHTILSLPVNIIANVTLSSVKKVLAKVKYGCPVWFSLLHPNSLLATKGVLAILGRGDNTKVLVTDL